MNSKLWPRSTHHNTPPPSPSPLRKPACQSLRTFLGMTNDTFIFRRSPLSTVCTGLVIAIFWGCSVLTGAVMATVCFSTFPSSFTSPPELSPKIYLAQLNHALPVVPYGIHRKFVAKQGEGTGVCVGGRGGEWQGKGRWGGEANTKKTGVTPRTIRWRRIPAMVALATSIFCAHWSSRVLEGSNQKREFLTWPRSPLKAAEKVFNNNVKVAACGGGLKNMSTAVVLSKF